MTYRRQASAWTVAALIAAQSACATRGEEWEGELELERRSAAEWEPAVGVLITWPLALPRELVEALARDTIVHVVVADEARERDARSTFTDLAIPDERLRIIRRPTEDGIRDWGPYAVFDERGKMTLRDPRYIDYALSGYDSSSGIAWWAKLEPGIDWSSDDETPLAVGQALGLEREEMSFCFTGGNVELDGMGTAFATEIMEHENAALGVAPDRLREAARRELGVDRLVLLPNFERDFEAQHIDCVARLLDEERWLVKRMPADHPDHDQVERVADALRALAGPWGRPYEVLRIDAPRYDGDAVAAYTNALILNRAVYVPLFGIEGDAAALATWRSAMPGYEVQGFLFDGPQRWTYTDALHCRTKALWDPGMLYLRHRRLDAVVAPEPRHEIELVAVDSSGAGFDHGALRVHWRLRGETRFDSAPLERVGQALWRGAIPGAAPAAEIEYWLEASDRSGRRETLPRTAPAGLYRFTVGTR